MPSKTVAQQKELAELSVNRVVLSEKKQDNVNKSLLFAELGGLQKRVITLKQPDFAGDNDVLLDLQNQIIDVWYKSHPDTRVQMSRSNKIRTPISKTRVKNAKLKKVEPAKPAVSTFMTQKARYTLVVFENRRHKRNGQFAVTYFLINDDAISEDERQLFKRVDGMFIDESTGNFDYHDEITELAKAKNKKVYAEADWELAYQLLFGSEAKFANYNCEYTKPDISDKDITTIYLTRGQRHPETTKYLRERREEKREERIKNGLFVL